MTDFIWDEMGDFDLENFRETPGGWFNWLKSQAAKFFQEANAHPVASVVFATHPAPMKYWAALPGHTNVHNKAAFTDFLHIKVAKARALGVGSMHEAWDAPEGVTDLDHWARSSPDDWSKIAGVREILQVVLETKKQHYLARAIITRNKEGVPSLGPWKDLTEVKRLGGQFAGFWLIE